MLSIKEEIPSSYLDDCYTLSIPDPVRKFSLDDGKKHDHGKRGFIFVTQLAAATINQPSYPPKTTFMFDRTSVSMHVPEVRHQGSGVEKRKLVGRRRLRRRQR